MGADWTEFEGDIKVLMFLPMPMCYRVSKGQLTLLKAFLVSVDRMMQGVLEHLALLIMLSTLVVFVPSLPSWDEAHLVPMYEFGEKRVEAVGK